MVSEVDQKYLGHFAKSTSSSNPTLSAALYKVLGLSTLLNRKLIRARKQRKLDPTRPTKSLDLYKHINWMGREGYTIIETILPHVDAFIELRVLVYKLKASFLHIFVLFEFTPISADNPRPPGSPNLGTGSILAPPLEPLSTTISPNLSPNISTQHKQHKKSSSLSPNLALLTTPSTSPSAGQRPLTPTKLTPPSYLLPATAAFQQAAALAAALLPGIHPLRLSVTVEYAAFMFDCVRDHDASRRLARQGVEDALEVVDALGDDDETFNDAQDLVGSLAIMAKRAAPVGMGVPAGTGTAPPSPPPPPQPPTSAVGGGDSRSR